MDALERRRFELHAKQRGYQRRIEQARDYIQRTADRFDSPCLHVSGGKDSLVLWRLAVECGVGWSVYHFDNGLLNVPGVTEYVRDRAREWDADLYVRTSEAANDERMVTDEGHGYNGYWGQYYALVGEHGWSCRVLGIRAAESNQRRDRFAGEGLPVEADDGDIATAPIHQLTTADVWAYIVDNELPYHDIYDKQGDLYDGIDARENRLVTLYDSEFDSLGAREISQFIYPHETNELKEIEKDNS
jgi:3'-phosphoadenosine 5'-phosphosulfate sulfotransferase (PAPS reductase)/FAD synthetase